MKFCADGMLSVSHQRNFSLKNRFTIGCGGVASYAFFPKKEEELSLLLRGCKEGEIPYTVVGNGSNLLPPDGFYDGAVIFTKGIKGVSRREGVLVARCGESFSALIAYGRENGLSCFEFMTGIPALVGGAVFMNAGVPERHISDAVKCVTATDGNEKKVFRAEECGFLYKESVFQKNGFVVLSAAFAVEETERDKVEERLFYYGEKRKRLPRGRSMGCVFKNPPGVSAGKLIDECSLKGLRVGGAYVSESHANFILNDGSASGKDVKALVALIKAEVSLRKGVLLAEEIQYFT